MFREIGDFLAPVRGVPPVRGGRVPRQRVFLVLWPREPLCGGGEDGGDGGGGDRVVAQVDEACFLETGEDGEGGGFALGGRAVEEGGEVDELVEEDRLA